MQDAGVGGRFLVTGATGGLGRRVCALLGQAGDEVLLMARTSGSLEALDEQVNRGHSAARRTYPVDFADTESTRAAAAALERTSGPLSGIVLIVPSVPKSPETIPPDDEWRAALDLCFVSPLAVLRAGLPNVREGGRMVIVSGIASVEVFPELPFSNVIRMAWLAEAKALSFALGPRRIRVNTVSLGGTLTERFTARAARRKAGDVPQRETPDQIPLGEYGDPDDAAYVIGSLLGRLSNHITGANIVFDGGLTRCY